MVERKKKPLFIRKDGNKQVKLGRGRRKDKKKWVWPRGRHNKFREKRKGHRKNPSIGYSQAREIRGTIGGLMPVLVNNIRELERVDKQKELAVFASVGMRNKIEMARKAQELGIKTNLNLRKFLKKVGKRAEWETKSAKATKPVEEGKKDNKDKENKEKSEEKKK